MILIFIQLIVGFSMVVYSEPYIFKSDMIQNELSNYDEMVVDFESNASLYGSTIITNDKLNENTLGNSFKWSSILIKTIFRSIVPFNLRPSLFDTNFEKSVAYLLNIVQVCLSFLILFEIFLIFKKNKTT